MPQMQFVAVKSYENVLKTIHLQQLKGMQGSKLGM